MEAHVIAQSVSKNLIGNVLMNGGVIIFAAASLNNTLLTPLTGSTARVVTNLAVAMFLWYLNRRRRSVQSSISLWGRNRPYLWIWGCLGTVTIVCFFQAASASGVGVANFMLAASGSLLALVSPFALGQRLNKTSAILAIVCLGGAAMLAGGLSGILQNTGPLWGIGSCVAAALAYYIVGQKLKDESVVCLMFYWSLVNCMVHLGLNLSHPITWPNELSTWRSIILSGLLASFGQYWVNSSFQDGDPSILGVVSYLSCVVALVFDAMILSHSFTHTQYLGAAILSIAGGLATYLNARKMEHFG